jgi:hypothetical protein
MALDTRSRPVTGPVRAVTRRGHRIGSLPLVKRPTAGGARPMAAGNIIKVGAIALGLATLLNSETLLDLAERQPLGSTSRSVGMALAEPLNDIAHFTMLDRPGEAVDDARGLNTETDTGFEDLVTSGSEGATETAGATGTEGEAAGDVATATSAPGDTIAPDDSTAGTVPATSGAPARPAGPPTAENPLRLYVAGDSLAQGYGETLEGQMAETGIVDVKSHYKVSSGLTRTDFFNWPAALQQDVNEYQPDIVVVTFGGNDGQNLLADDGSVVEPEDPKWAEIYRARVAAVMDFLSADGREVIWVGTPNAREDTLQARMEIIRTAVSEEAAARSDRVTYIDAFPLFASPSGGYADYVVDEDGVAKQMRAGDGFHFSLNGAQRMTRYIREVLDAEIESRGGVL